MPPTIEVDIKELLDQINQKLDSSTKEINQKIDSNHTQINQKIDSSTKEINQKLDTLAKDVTDLRLETKVGQARLEEKLSAMETRMNFQEFLTKGILITLTAAVFGILAKVFGFIGNA